MELEALYEGLCRREPDLFEPESLHKQIQLHQCVGKDM